MNGNSFGTLFKVTSWGESHGEAIGCVIDGCPSRIPLSEDDFKTAMERRQGGTTAFSTARQESDRVLIESGVWEGNTTGAPIALRILNQDIRSKDYEVFKNTPRPGHADYTLQMKHGVRDWRGGGRLSARETATRVAAGVVAEKILQTFGIEVLGFVARIAEWEFAPREQLYGKASSLAQGTLDWENVARLCRSNTLVAPIEGALLTETMDFVVAMKEQGDSLGGAIEVWVRGLPPGLGEPVFDKAQALLGQALLSLPAAVAFESGGGIAMSEARGSQIRDTISARGVEGNRHGGLLGGMTTGCPLRVRVYFHAPTSIPQEISSYNFEEKQDKALIVGGRHDSLPLPRAVPMAEAMVKIILVDMLARAGRLAEK